MYNAVTERPAKPADHQATLRNILIEVGSFNPCFNLVGKSTKKISVNMAITTNLFILAMSRADGTKQRTAMS